MVEIATLQSSGHGSKFTANAEQLLTRWWAPANWNARSKLLKTADWLLRVENSATLVNGRKREVADGQPS
jgi:hypothetical protein